MVYTSDLYAPLFAKLDDHGKLVAVCCHDPTPGSTRYIDVTLSLMQLFAERATGEVPMTTQDDG
jgi:hypothetical protein